MYFWDTMNEPANQWDYILGDSVPFIVVFTCVVDIIPNKYSHLDAFGWYHPTYFRDIGDPFFFYLVNFIINNPNRCLSLGYKILQSDPQSLVEMSPVSWQPPVTVVGMVYCWLTTLLNIGTGFGGYRESFAYFGIPSGKLT